MVPKPIFILGISRSGTTLLQRVLAASPYVESTSEPLFLAPILAPLIPDCPAGGVWHGLVTDALADMSKLWPAGVDSYRRAARDLALGLYTEAASPDAKYFVDKSPIYWTIVAELFKVFPDAKFVFIWRNPLAVISSCVETWSDGRWRVEDYRYDWFAGLPTLVSTYEAVRDRSYALRYEDLVQNGSDTVAGLFQYLDIPFDQGVLEAFSKVDLGGRLGDPSGVHMYGALSTDPLRKWHRTVDTPVRRLWCHRYLSWLGPHRLDVMGYDMRELQAQLAESTGSGQQGRSLSDAANVFALGAREMLKARQRSAAPPSSWRRLAA